jgi:hypothetical protein
MKHRWWLIQTNVIMCGDVMMKFGSLNVLDCGNSKYSAMTMFWGCTGGGTIIANLHITCERMPIFWPFFVDDNNK